MRVGLIVPRWVPSPPRGHGGTGPIEDDLAGEPAAVGREVQLLIVGAQ